MLLIYKRLGVTQLCLGNNENQLKPQKTSFSNISKISGGNIHSLFQNNKGEIFTCAYNKDNAKQRLKVDAKKNIIFHKFYGIILFFYYKLFSAAGMKKFRYSIY